MLVREERVSYFIRIPIITDYTFIEQGLSFTRGNALYFSCYRLVHTFLLTYNSWILFPVLLVYDRQVTQSIQGT